MGMIDERGRIAGRFNLIDVLLAALVLVLIPAAYGAYLLFRTPRPKLLSITPPSMHQGERPRIEIQGQDLRPFMRVSFGDTQGRSFLISSTRSALVDLPDLPVGAYDVVLYDYSQEVARLPKAFTIQPVPPAPTIDLQIGGVFVGLSAAAASGMKVGQRFPPGADSAEILSIGNPTAGTLRVRAGDQILAVPLQNTDLPATLRVKCSLVSNPDGTQSCTAYGAMAPMPIAPNSFLTLASSAGWLRFQINEVHVITRPPIATAHVRFVVTPEQLAQMKPGDVDSGPRASALFHQATLGDLGGARAISAVEAGSSAPLGGMLRVVEATVKVPLDPAPWGWSYKEAPFKIGAPFSFETDRYIVRGEIVNMSSPAVPAAKAPGTP